MQLAERLRYTHRKVPAARLVLVTRAHRWQQAPGTVAGFLQGVGIGGHGGSASKDFCFEQTLDRQFRADGEIQKQTISQ